jgi:ParB/RepB/Spo0J family partition protein
MPTRARMDALREFGIVGQGELFKIEPTKIRVREGWNPRQDFDITDLAANIRVNGVKRPLLVKREDDGHYVLVDGERRLRAVLACIEDGCEILSVPCMVEPPRTSDAESLVDALVSNQGKPFTPEEEAEAFRRFVAWDWSIEKIAQRVGRSQSYVRDRLRLLEATAPVLEAARTGAIPWSAAMHVVRTSHEPERQAELVLEAQEAREEQQTQRAERREARASRRPAVNGDERFTPAEKQVFKLVDALGMDDVITHLARYCELEQHTEMAEALRRLLPPLSDGADMVLAESIG